MTFLKKSPWVIHYDGSSCNGCDIEVLACLTPVYDVERFGIINTGNPKHADIFLLTGTINAQNKEVVQNIYEQMPDPKVVVAIGICATSAGVFAECYNVLGGADAAVPVDVYVPGCAARPESIIDGVVKSLGILEEKRKKMQLMASCQATMTIVDARSEDAVEILSLQKLAYQSEAELYNDYSLTPLRQTLDELKADFAKMTYIKAVVDNRIIGAVRAYREGEICHIGRLSVHPSVQNCGLGSKMLAAIEKRFENAGSFEVFTGHKSRRNIHFYEKRGYKIFKREKVSEKRDRVYLEKMK